MRESLGLSQIFLLDTSFVVAFLRRDATQQVLDRMRELVSSDQAATNGLVRMEVLIGCRTVEDYDRVSLRISALKTLPVDEDTWRIASRLGFDLRRAGVTLGMADLGIAGTAIRHSAVLIHIDSDFERIAQYSELRTESHLDSV